MTIRATLWVEIPSHSTDGKVDAWSVPVFKSHGPVIRERRNSVDGGCLYAHTEDSEPGQEWIEVVWLTSPNPNLTEVELENIERALEGLRPNVFCGGGSWNPRGSDPIRSPLSILVEKSRGIRLSQLELLKIYLDAEEVDVWDDLDGGFELIVRFGKGEE